MASDSETTSDHGRYTPQDREMANLLLLLRSAPSRDSCPSTACAACSCSRRTTRSQIHEEDEYADMPALIPIETPGFRPAAKRRAVSEDEDMPALIPLSSRTREGSRRVPAPSSLRPIAVRAPVSVVSSPSTTTRTTARLPRMAVLHAMDERAFEAFLGTLDNSAIELLRRTSDLVLASETNLHAWQRNALLEEIRERSSADARAYSVRRRPLGRI